MVNIFKVINSKKIDISKIKYKILINKYKKLQSETGLYYLLASPLASEYLNKEGDIGDIFKLFKRWDKVSNIPYETGKCIEDLIHFPVS